MEAVKKTIYLITGNVANQLTAEEETGVVRAYPRK